MNSNYAYKYGSLPQNGALGAAYVPIQNSVEPYYDREEALSQGTLFPGLNLPFMNMLNSKEKSGPYNELMAIDFVTDELELYLDTHKTDEEAFGLLKTFYKLRTEAHRRYLELYGPVQQRDMESMKSYSWIQDPWPWDYSEKGAK